MLPGVPKSVREWTLTFSNELPCWEIESQWTPEWARIAHLDIWNTSYDKKERSGVKLAIWLPTTKSQVSTRFCCV
jgi:hypothetical protein